MSPPARPDRQLHDDLRHLLAAGWIDAHEMMPDYGGSGAPGKLLEHLLGLDGGNDDGPDSGRWEIKYHSGNSLLTLFHKEAKPAGHLRELVDGHGWRNSGGGLSFRHTIKEAPTAKGFYVENRDNRIQVMHNRQVMAWWMHDTLLAAFVAKFRRLIVVRGSRRGRNDSLRVRYESALVCTEPRASLFVDAVASGLVAIDFDARTKRGTNALRNHGTKFRIAIGDIHRLYNEVQPFN